MKRTTLSPPFQVLVANFTGESDSKGNPIKARTQFKEQWVYGIGDINRIGLLGDFSGIANATASITVSDNDFSTGTAVLTLDGNEILAGTHFTVGASASDTATNLAAVINALDGFIATSAAALVSVVGPTGPDGGNIILKSIYLGSITNYTLSPTTGYMAAGGPLVGPPEIT